MINHAVIVGRLTNDPEINYTNTGVAVTKFTVACDRYKGDTDFIRVTVWDKQAESAANYLSKGKMVGVVGSIKTGSYEGKDGKKVFTTEVQAKEVKFLSPPDKNDKPNQNSRPQQTFDPDHVDIDDFATVDDDESLPF